MSWLTQFVREIGFGGALDHIEAAEKAPSPATIAGAVIATAGAAGAPVNPTVAAASASSIINAGVTDTVARLLPGEAAIAAAVLPPLLGELETVIAKHFAG
ncbi:MAG TPA: hypothetical protein VGH15_09640 [Caulobacteraceae bacterium]